MVSICPTITVTTKEEYDQQLKLALKLTRRVHIDLSDGSMAPRRLLGLSQMRWGRLVKADLHIMSKHPNVDVSIASLLRPNLVIVHAEADVDFRNIADQLHAKHIKFGVALLQSTSPTVLSSFISEVDHVLIFSGNLGYQGGSVADLGLVTKLPLLKEMKPSLEIGWDGGANDSNVSYLAEKGVEVINVGGFLQRATNPKQAYAKLKREIKK